MVLSQDRNNEYALFYKFKAFKGLKQYENALKIIDELINSNPTDKDYLNEKRELLKLI